MPIKLNVGLSKKIGMPDYASLGASSQVELELPDGRPSGFQVEAQRAFAACLQAVDDELARHQTTGGKQEPDHTPAPKNGTAQGAAHASGRPPTSSPARASGKQLAGEIRDLGARRLEGLAQQCSVSPSPICRASTPAR